MVLNINKLHKLEDTLRGTGETGKKGDTEETVDTGDTGEKGDTVLRHYLTEVKSKMGEISNS